MRPQNIVYLFGAGTTMAEAGHAGIENKLSLRGVSEKVVQKAKKVGALNYLLGDISSENIVDIERYISLLESLGIRKYAEAASKLKDMFCECTQEGLIQGGKPIEPELAMALLEMHNAADISKIEQLKGIITLNYDNLLDRAFNKVLGGVNFGIAWNRKFGKYKISERGPVLIKLHGSFNWKHDFPIRVIDQGKGAGEEEEMIWVPPGIQKEVNRYPFNLLWGKAFELLDCDVLRIVGCSLSQNDWALMSLLFFSQLKSNRGYQIELINSHEEGMNIRQENGFLKHVKVLGELDNCQEFVDVPPKNVFETWLKIKLNSFLTQRIDRLQLKHVDKLMEWN